MKQVFGCAFATLILVAVGATRGDDAKSPALDEEFLKRAAAVNHAEIEIGKLAGKRAHDEKVRNYADQLVKDHQSSYELLARLLKDRKLAIVSGLDPEHRDEVSRLSSKEAKEFDQAFLHCMVKGHENAVKLYETQANQGKDDAIRAYAKGTLPTLQRHLTRAKELHDAK